MDVRDWSLVIEEGIAELEIKRSHDQESWMGGGTVEHREMGGRHAGVSSGGHRVAVARFPGES